MLDSLVRDLRYAARMMVRSPGFTLAAVVTLAIGVGAVTATFSVVEAVLLRRLPYADADRLVYVWERNFHSGRPTNVVGPMNFIRWKERSASFESLVATTEWTGNVTGVGEPDKIRLGYVGADFFEMLGARAEIGRPLQPVDGVAGHDDVVVLSYGYWMRKFGGDSAAIGRTISLDGKPKTIVGVMPVRFHGLMLVDMWTPRILDDRYRTARGRYMTVFGKLKPGVSLQQAQAEMTSIAAAIETEIPDFSGGWGVNVVPLREQLVQKIRPAILILFGAVTLVLLIAGSNVANLLLARGAERQREIAVRLALGASRGRVIGQMLSESLMLSTMGAAAGSLMAVWAVEGLRPFLPPELARFTDVQVNAPVLVFALLLATGTGLLFGALPAIAATRAPIDPALREGSKGSSEGRGKARLRSALVIAEVSLSLLLLVAAGLLLRSFYVLSNVDIGLQPEGVLSLDVALFSEKYGKPGAAGRFFDRAVEEIGSIPGVSSTGAMSWRLMSTGSVTDYRVEGEPIAAPGQELATHVRMVTPALFETLRIPILRGRAFTKEDSADAPKRVIVNQALAQAHWPGKDPIGRHLYMDWYDKMDAEVIGVVGDVRLTAVDAEPQPTTYWALAQVPNSQMAIMVRSPLDPAGLTKAIKSRLATIDADVPIAGVQTLDQVISDSLDSRRFTAILLEIFAAVALALAALGNYAVMAFSVSRRTREIGVRMALGACARDVMGMVIRQGMSLAVVGLLVGAAGSLAISRFMSGLLYRVSPTDPGVFAAVSLLLAAVLLLACYVPARRATRIDPMITLRSE